MMTISTKAEGDRRSARHKAAPLVAIRDDLPALGCKRDRLPEPDARRAAFVELDELRDVRRLEEAEAVERPRQTVGGVRLEQIAQRLETVLEVHRANRRRGISRRYQQRTREQRDRGASPSRAEN